MNLFRSFCEEGGHVRESMCLIYRAVWQEKHLEDPQASLLTDESNGHLPGWHKPHYFQRKLTVRMSKKVVCCLGLFAGSEKWAHFFSRECLVYKWRLRSNSRCKSPSHGQGELWSVHDDTAQWTCRLQVHICHLFIAVRLKSQLCGALSKGTIINSAWRNLRRYLMSCKPKATILASPLSLFFAVEMLQWGF